MLNPLVPVSSMRLRTVEQIVDTRLVRPAEQYRALPSLLPTEPFAFSVRRETKKNNVDVTSRARVMKITRNRARAKITTRGERKSLLRRAGIRLWIGW